MTFKNSGLDPFTIIGMVLIGILVACGLSLLTGWFVKLLWNWLMPTIFNFPTITFWQGWGLCMLTHILFKSTNTMNTTAKKE